MAIISSTSSCCGDNESLLATIIFVPFMVAICSTVVIPNKNGILFQLKLFQSKKILSQSKSE
jgi:hypothetical protein